MRTQQAEQAARGFVPRVRPAVSTARTAPQQAAVHAAEQQLARATIAERDAADAAHYALGTLLRLRDEGVYSQGELDDAVHAAFRAANPV